MNYFAESNSAPAFVGTAKFPGAGVTDCSALPKTIYGNALASESAVDLVFIELVKVDRKIALPS